MGIKRSTHLFVLVPAMKQFLYERIYEFSHLNLDVGYEHLGILAVQHNANLMIKHKICKGPPDGAQRIDIKVRDD
jgi:hypothetical protein